MNLLEKKSFKPLFCFQSGFNLVMTHPRCVNEITLSLNSKNPRWVSLSVLKLNFVSLASLHGHLTHPLCCDRTKALVLELLAAVCLVRGGHDIILSAFDNFKEVKFVFDFFSGVFTMAQQVPCDFCSLVILLLQICTLSWLMMKWHSPLTHMQCCHIFNSCDNHSCVWY